MDDVKDTRLQDLLAGCIADMRRELGEGTIGNKAVKVAIKHLQKAYAAGLEDAAGFIEDQLRRYPGLRKGS